MTHVKITVGTIQLEYEGDAEFLENKLPAFLEQIIEIVGGAPQGSNSGEAAVYTDRPTNASPELSTNTIAQTIGVKTGSELALAAVAKINLIKNRPTAARQEILEEMKGATTYFKDSYASNLSSYLDTLVKSKRINLVARATFALAAMERARLEEILGARP